jgi:glutaconyl-CoA decarboxylase
MKNLKVTVNGVAYDVQVEEQAADASAPTPMAAPAPASAAAPKPTSKAAPAPAAKPTPVVPAADTEIIKSPMPGTIVDVKVQPGQSIKSGDVMLILEAMKMENEIMAPHDATVNNVLVTKGQSVEAATPLVSLR